MKPGRERLVSRSEGKQILNLFAYTCSFSVAALMSGAAKVVNMDMSRGALAQGQRNHVLNGLGLNAGATFLPHNLFKSWGRLQRLGPFDLVIVDPPTRQPGSFVADKDYAKVLSRLPSVLADGAELLLCVNAPALGEEWLQELVCEHLPGARFQERLLNRCDFPEVDASRNLKMLSYVLDN
jgi:23S rRNA (cytosine1962-C5)-methyltransferase